MIFSAVRTGDPSLPANENYVHPGDDITFDDTVTNIGNGMDPKTGVFTAPVSGIYSFSFSAIQSFWAIQNDRKIEKFGSIQVLKGGMVEFYFFDYGEITRYGFKPISYTWMMSLLQNEKVHLKMDKSSDGQIEVHNAPKRKNFVWFNGQLLYASE